jgi:hypothetical protein
MFGATGRLRQSCLSPRAAPTASGLFRSDFAALFAPPPASLRHVQSGVAATLEGSGGVELPHRPKSAIRRRVCSEPLQFGERIPDAAGAAGAQLCEAWPVARRRPAGQRRCRQPEKFRRSLPRHETIRQVLAGDDASISSHTLTPRGCLACEAFPRVSKAAVKAPIPCGVAKLPALANNCTGAHRNRRPDSRIPR